MPAVPIPFSSSPGLVGDHDGECNGVATAHNSCTSSYTIGRLKGTSAQAAQCGLTFHARRVVHTLLLFPPQPKPQSHRVKPSCCKGLGLGPCRVSCMSIVYLQTAIPRPRRHQRGCHSTHPRLLHTHDELRFGRGRPLQRRLDSSEKTTAMPSMCIRAPVSSCEREVLMSAP